MSSCGSLEMVRSRIEASVSSARLLNIADLKGVGFRGIRVLIWGTDVWGDIEGLSRQVRSFAGGAHAGWWFGGLFFVLVDSWPLERQRLDAHGST